jgi:hypothetical protein
MSAPEHFGVIELKSFEPIHGFSLPPKVKRSQSILLKGKERRKGIGSFFYGNFHDIIFSTHKLYIAVFTLAQKAVICGTS